MKAESTYSLKDDLFNKEKVEFLADQFSSAWPDFSRKNFIDEVVEKFPDLELKERIVHISECLESHLPDSFPKACGIILKALPEELDPDLTDNDFGDYILAPLSHYVVRNGCSKKHLDRSLKVLREITKRFSAEDAIRYFINQFPDETYTFLEECSLSENYHVRRWASEGTRPKLPWSQKLETPHERAVPILENLYSDSTRYVTRSVANHLNDISKLNPDTVTGLLKQWKKSGGQSQKELDYIARHSLRTLVKDAHPGALKLLGYSPSPSIEVSAFAVEKKKVKAGEAVVFLLSFESAKSQKLLVDYYMESPGGRGKIFKWKQISAKQGERMELRKSHPMKLMTTRALVSGKYTVTLQINGTRFDSLEFELSVPGI